MQPIVKLDNVSLTYHTKTNETTAIKGLSLEIAKGELVGIVGPSGCGKTTILSMIGGILAPTEGRVEIDGITVNATQDKEDAEGMDAKKWFAKKALILKKWTSKKMQAARDLFRRPRPQKEYLTGYMLQKDELFAWRSIYSNIMLGLEIANKKTPENMKYADELLKKYSLSEFKDYYPSQLSGGMRQRVALIRTLVLSPKILLLDEPFSALDFQTRLHLVDDVHHIIKSEKQTAVFVTHDISEAVSMCDRILVLNPRPSSVKCEFDLTEFGDKAPLMRREDPRFGRYFESVWKQMEN